MLCRSISVYVYKKKNHLICLVQTNLQKYFYVTFSQKPFQRCKTIIVVQSFSQFIEENSAKM